MPRLCAATCWLLSVGAFLEKWKGSLLIHPRIAQKTSLILMRSIPEQEIDTSCISFIIYLQKLLYMRLETSNGAWPWGELHCGIMSKVSSVSDGSLFRVKCVIFGINSCPWRWVRPNPPLYRSRKQNFAILFCLCCIPLPP